MRMFVRMLTRAALVQPGRAASALLAVVVAAAVASAMLNLYADVGAKLRKEFRSYGANIVVVAPSGGALPVNALATAERVLDGRGIAVPFAYAVARTNAGQPVVVAGTDLERARKMNSWWSVTGWPEHGSEGAGVGQADTRSLDSAAQNRRGLARDDTRFQTAEALVGVRAAAVATPEDKPFGLSFEGRTMQLEPAGRLRTGAAEDSRIYLDLEQFESWTGVQPSSIEIGASGTPQEIDATLHALSAALPGAEVRPVRQIVEGEARVLGKTRAALLAAIAIIILTAALCVVATLTAWVLDRRRDFAIMKALGASERLVNGFFAAEAACIGVIGAVAGFAIGIAVAAWIGRANFHAAISPRWSIFPIVLAGSVGLALMSSVLPIGLLRRVQPATILRGE